MIRKPREPFPETGANARDVQEVTDFLDIPNFRLKTVLKPDGFWNSLNWFQI
jgi:hypothetical protein